MKTYAVGSHKQCLPIFMNKKNTYLIPLLTVDMNMVIDM